MEIDSYIKIVPLMGPLDESGDLGIVVEDETHCYIGLIDALGHGKKAHEAASRAHDFLQSNFNTDMTKIMGQMHEQLKNSRGAVAALCCLNKLTGTFKYTGIGNITTRILGSNSHKLVPKDGILGYSIPTPREEYLKLYSGDVLALYSDGLKENFDLLDHPGLLNLSAEQIAKKLFNTYAKDNDDASIIVLKVER